VCACFTCFLGVHKKLVDLVGGGFGEAETAHSDSRGVTDLGLSHLDAEGTVLDVRAVAVHAHDVLADFTRRERDAQASVAQLLEQTGLLVGRGRANGGVQVANVAALDHLETDVGLVAEDELIALEVRVARDVSGEGRARDVLVGELDRDGVVARRGRVVDHVARAVLVVAALNLGLAGPLDGHGQAARARVLRDYAELAGLVAHAVRQAGAVRGHVATRAVEVIARERVERVYVKLERRALDGLAVVENVQFVEAHLARLVLDRDGAVRVLLDARAGYFAAGHLDSRAYRLVS
jgi:hypothetical protein